MTSVDGLREVSRAREAGVAFEELYVCRELLERFAGQQAVDQIFSWGIEICEVSRMVMEKMSYGDRHEGVLAVIRIKNFLLSSENLQATPLIVVLENVEKPGNLGAILRSCDGAGVDAVMVADPKADIWNPNVIRASTGVVFSMAVMQGTLLQVRDFLKAHQIKIVAATPSGKHTYFSSDLKGPVAIVLGAEDKGLSDFWIDSADFEVSIPMRGKADSLNVSISAAVLVYEALRQRNFKST